MVHREPKKETKMKNKKNSTPETIDNDEIKKSTSKGLIKGTE